MRWQVAAGLDIVNDGEASKPSYSTYIQERLTGFGQVDAARLARERHREHEAFRDYYAQERRRAPARKAGASSPASGRSRCATAPASSATSPISARAAAIHRPVAGFMTAASPGVIARFHPNAYYPSSKAYREALAAAMQEEYEAIVAAGFILQLDCPDLASGWKTVFADLRRAEFLRECETSIEILNDALRDVPAERTRMHLCWGNYEGPHIHDIPLEKILPAVLKAKPAGPVVRRRQSAPRA